MPSLLLLDYLERRRTVYQLLRHRPAAGAEQTARALGIPSRRFGKVVMLRLDEELAMMVVPAHYRVELGRLRHALGVARVEVATPRQFQHRFPRCESGAMPPFGHLFGLRTLSSALVDDFDIAFKAGTHSESVLMPFCEFRRLAHTEEIPGCASSQIRARMPRRSGKAFEAMTVPLRPLPARHLLPLGRPKPTAEVG